jgi:hypothetical protein
MSINIKFTNNLKVKFSVSVNSTYVGDLPAGTCDASGNWHQGTWSYETSGDTPTIELSANPSPDCELTINSSSVSETTPPNQPNLTYTFALSKSGGGPMTEPDVNVTVGANQP